MYDHRLASLTSYKVSYFSVSAAPGCAFIVGMEIPKGGETWCAKANIHCYDGGKHANSLKNPYVTSYTSCGPGAAVDTFSGARAA